ncbi:hypothetical protein [Algoriphagus marincola]|uniref:hypothetical protein n=1 Tax=Algoriphagus marincola TaxID=264027 RepID=UPI00041ABA90|nr:hypothetical protein [Algoriphagus marincola]
MNRMVKSKILVNLFLLILISWNSLAQTSNIEFIVKTSRAKLTDETRVSSKTLKALNRGDTLELIEIVIPNLQKSFNTDYLEELLISPNGPQEWYKVNHKGTIGFISSSFIEKDSLVEKQISESKAIIFERNQRIKNRSDSIEKARRDAEQELFLRQKKDREEKEMEEIRKNDSIALIMLKNAKAQNSSLLNNSIQLRRDRFQKKYGKEVGEKVAKKLIWIGMTEEMLLDSWGEPEDINKTVTRYSISKQYVYGLGQYVYVVDGKVEAWQN